ncbi:SDR family oxidoreductase [Acidothermaceae bacterium B102]|nr:SDR family oxidoreductase [Acidothermaceae bacterium B102]
MTVLALTGSTGRLGGRVARQLAAAGVHQRLLVRDALRAPQLPDTEVAVMTYRDGDAVRRSLDGAGTVFMVSAAEAPDRVDEHFTFVDAAAAAGVTHLVYTSFLAASPTSTFTLGRDHWATEEHIKASGIPYTFLRDNLYADFLQLMVGADDAVRGPAGDGRVSAVAIADVADAATAVLLSPETHAGRTYDLTGPQALSLEEVAATLTAGLGRPIRFENETLEEAYASRASYGAPDWEVDAWVSTYTSIAAGEQAAISPHVEQLTGHPATALADLLRG